MRAENPTSSSYDSKKSLLPECCSILYLILLLCGTALTWETRLFPFMWCAITQIHIDVYTHIVAINKTFLLEDNYDVYFHIINFSFLIGIFFYRQTDLQGMHVKNCFPSFCHMISLQTLFVPRCNDKISSCVFIKALLDVTFWFIRCFQSCLGDTK